MYTIDFKDTNAQHVNDVGGKGAMLGELMRLAPTFSVPMSVPDGFNIYASAFGEWIHSAGMKDENIALALKTIGKDPIGLEAMSKAAIAKLSTHPVPESLVKELKGRDWKGSYAVRSSAIGEDGDEASFAGQHDSFLNVKTFNGVVEAIRNVWLSAFEPRALYYRCVNDKITEPLRQGVVVQNMVAAEMAGVAFSVDTRTGSRRHGFIEYVKGLGDKLVSGEVTPEHYSFLKEALEEPNDVVSTVAAAITELEHVFGWPADVEWAWDGKLQLLQIRPLTAIPDELSTTQIDSMELSHVEYGAPITIGQALARGQATVRGFISREQARLMLKEKNPRWKMEQRVLLVSFTTPRDMEVLEKVAGVVVSKGGVTSHAAIVCRELAKPCMRVDSMVEFEKLFPKLNKGVGVNDFSTQPGFLDANITGSRAAWYSTTTK